MFHDFLVNFHASVRDAFGDLFWKPFGSFGLHFLKLVRSNSHQNVTNNRCGNWHRTKQFRGRPGTKRFPELVARRGNGGGERRKEEMKENIRKKGKRDNFKKWAIRPDPMGRHIQQKVI